MRIERNGSEIRANNGHGTTANDFIGSHYVSDQPVERCINAIVAPSNWSFLGFHSRTVLYRDHTFETEQHPPRMLEGRLIGGSTTQTVG